MIRSSMHPSGLQTSQYNREPNPLQRHLNNKTALWSFYQQIGKSLDQETKLQRLDDVEFVNWYKKVRYWYACKYVSNEEGNEEFEITKMKVSNRQFSQIMKDNKEIEFDLRSASSVVVQPKSHHKYINDTLKLSKEIEREYESENNGPYLEQIKLIHERNRQYFGIFTRWHFQQASSRIVVLVKDNLDKDKMLFIYNKESEENEPINESRMALCYFENNDPTTTYMKEIIKCHHCKQLNQRILGRFKQVFSESVRNDFKRKINDVLEAEKLSQNRLTGNLRLMECFRQYDRFQSEDMIKRWKGKSSQRAKEKQLMVEVSEIWIRKAGNLKSVNLNIKNYRRQQNQQEDYNKKYVYSRVQGEYTVYEVAPEETSRCSVFELVLGTLSKELSIKVEVVNQSNNRQSFFNNYVYFKSEGADAFSHIINLLDSSKEFGHNDQTCSIVLKTKETRNLALKSVEMHHQRALFDQVGAIPTKYRSSLSINYTPDTYSTIRLLLASQLAPKLTKNSYQKCYYNLVQFIQSQQNKSQLSVASVTSSNAVDKCPMRQRLSFYERQILKEIGDIDVNNILKGSPIIHESRKVTTAQQNKLIAYLSILDQKMFADLCGREFTVNQVTYKNLQEDLLHYKPLNQVLVNQLLVKFLHFINRVPKIRQFGYELRYTSFLIPIIEKYILIFFNSKQAADDQVNNQNRNVVHFFVFVLFVARVYAYSEFTNLRNDLYILRHLVRERLPYYNDFLNRSNIGLQNLIGPHLLNLFTDLSEELTFRIWDFLISSDNIFKARIVVAFTLLTYFEATRNLPIIPINQFMQKVYENHHKINITIDFARQMEKFTDAYFTAEQHKTRKLERLVEGKEKTIVSDKYLQRIILGDTLSSAEKQEKIHNHFQNNRSVQSIREITYPLPRPNYFGHPITEIIVFVHNLNILDNLNLMAQKYSLRFTIPEAKSNSTVQIPILSKNHFYNQSFKAPLYPLPEDRPEREDSRTILVQIIKKGAESIELSGKLNYSNYHKDKAYKAVIALTAKDKHNKGETILNLSFCLKSSQYNRMLEEKNKAHLQTLSEKVLDYNIGEGSQVMGSLRDLYDTFEQIKNPLDEFSTDQNRRLQNSAINMFQSAWLENSKTTVEEIKTIFYHVFPQEKEQDLKLEFSKIYEIFSEEHRMQHVYLAEVLTRLVLSLNITRKKKLTYLYCLGVHYQNTYSKKVTSETINSIMRLILRQKQILTACPYEIETCGKIIEASFFRSSLKSEEEKNDFTEILQDWAYMCAYKFEFNAIILGTANNLSILRALFEESTLRQIESQAECRFEIVYEIEGRKCLWSAVVDPLTFNIIKRGTKFLNTFDGYAQLKYLDSTQEYLYNCENIIPLQAHKTFNYSQFTQVMLENQLVKYALELPSKLAKEPVKLEQVRPRNATDDSRSSNMYTDHHQRDKLDVMVIDQQEEQSYDSWALHRSQNCLESWRKCCIVNPGPVLSEIKYCDDPQLYTVSTLDLISMDEIDLQSGAPGSHIY